MNHTSDPPAVSVIMPTYNEAGHIQDLIRETARVLRAASPAEFELIVVDDDSPDGTWQKAEATGQPEGGRLRVIRRLSEHGLTASIREGIRSSSGGVVVWMDCDFSHPPEKIPQMLYMIGEGFDVAVNSRYAIGGGEDRGGKGGALQLLLSRVLNWGVRFMLKPSFSDFTSGFIAARRNVLEEFPLEGDYGEYFIDFIYRVLRSGRFQVCEMPYVAPPRRSGESKTGTSLGQYLRRGRKYLWTVLRLRLGLRSGKGARRAWSPEREGGGTGP